MDTGDSEWQRKTASWQMVTMGITLRRSYVCLCCLTVMGLGMNRGTATYCLRCWEPYMAEQSCEHDVLPRRGRLLAS